MLFSLDQKSALSSLILWFKDKNKKQVITLGGYAGTGKTTLIAEFRKKIEKISKDIRVNFCSYTGKAVQVMKSKIKSMPKDNISTIHSLIYSPIEDDHDRIIGWEKKDEIKGDLIIVDEASMIDEIIWADLLSYRIPIVAVGDHGQLPPISGKFNLMENPDLKLEKIHRQAEDNPIIKLSIMAREKGIIPSIPFGENVKKYSRSNPDVQEEIKEIINRYDKDTLILCGYNSTRVKLNKYVRDILGFERENPQQNDQVICLRNNHKAGIFNGMQGIIISIYSESRKSYYAEIEMADGKIFSGPILKEQFNNPKSLNLTEHRRKTLNLDLFDYGYAITVHKAQGSQAKKVILFEERFPNMENDMWRRWLYTGITRAEKELNILG